MDMGQNIEDQSSCPLSGDRTQQASEATPPLPSPPLASPNGGSNQPSSLPEVSGPPPKKSRQTRSVVWNHFEKIEVNGVPKARCLHCNQRLSAGAKNGTSHLKDHIDLRCPLKNVKLDVKQQILSYSNRGDGKAKVENYNFDQGISRKELANMVAMHEYPLSIVDHIGFKRFVTSLNPSFKLITRNTLRSDILKLFSSNKTALKKMFEDHNGRVAITTDMWTASHQKKGYMAITSHFIDDQWVLHNRTLRFAYVPSPHTKDVMAQVLLDCFNAYNIAEKISAIVVDNLSTNDAMIEVLRERFDSSSLIMDGEFLHMRCSAHILNLIVQDGMSVIDKGIEKIRDCVLFWTATQKRVEKFEDKIRAMKLDSSRKLSLDCKTRWNSIFLMLQSALPYRDVFVKLKVQNPSFKFVLPSDEEWNLASKVCKKLELFNKATKLFSGRNYPTANAFFKLVCEIKMNLDRWVCSDELVVRSMASKMLEKFDKYWSRVNGILAIAAVLDPRDKLECVDFYFRHIYGELADIEIERVKELLYKVLCEYQKSDSSNGEDYERKDDNSSALGKRIAMGDLAETVSEVSLWDLAKKNRKKKICVRSELDIYLEESALPFHEGFDVLHYWKLDLKYPTLRKVAKDILAIPASSVASESAFSVGGRVVSAHRSKLKPNTIEALMCLQNWTVEELAGYQIDEIQAYGTCLTDTDDPGEENSTISDVIDPIEEDE